jgi:glycosyltransferase involved in cell wall biosynthesis
VILMQYPSWAFGRSFAPLAIAMSQLSAPLVVMLHEFVAAHPMRKLAVGALLARADLVGVTADRERDSLRAWYPWLRNRLRNIPIASNIPSRPWAPSLPPTATYFGQLRPGKGLEEFFDCHARTSQQMPHVAFRIVGSLVPQCASYGEAIRKRAQACGIKMLIGAGSAEVAEALSQATVALLPFPGGASFRRGSLFAAANCGVPIATLVGDDTPHDLLPFLDHARDVDTLTAVTIRYLSSQEDRYIAHARSMELAIRFGWDKTISRYLKVFAEAIRKKAGDGTRILHPDSKYFAFGPSNRQDLGRESAGETNA